MVMKFCGVVVILVGLIGGGAVCASTHLLTDARAQTARERVQRGEPNVALAILRPLAQTNRPDLTDIRFLIGLAAILVQGSLGVGIAHARRASRQYSGSQHGSLGINTLLPKDWTLGGRHTWRHTQFRHNSPTIHARRIDRHRIVQVFLLHRGFTVFGFSPQLIAIEEQQQSNSAIAIYRRKRTDLRFVRQF